MKKQQGLFAPDPARPEVELVQPSTDVPSDAPFPYRDYRNARDAILRALRAGSTYIALTGPSGTGKTALGEEVQDLLERPRFQIVYVSSSTTSVRGMVNSLAHALRVSPKRTSLETTQLVAQALKGTATHYVLWFDEADLVSIATLVEVRILAESDLGARQLLSVVLSGLPDLRASLDARELFPLKRRISLRCHLAGLGRDELDAFLVHRYGTATAGRFPSELRDELFERTEAAPALVHKVARFALERASTGLVTEAILREVLNATGL